MNKPQSYRVVVVGASGLVGSTMLRVLEERQFPVDALIPVASPASVGKTLRWKDQGWAIVSPDTAIQMGADLALFSAGGSVSLEWAPRFAQAGIRVIDNSSAWRMDPSVPLVVPEVNAHALQSPSLIVANPNCSTIQLVVALNLLHREFRIRRIVVSTYQSVTGTGVKAVSQLMNERGGIDGPMAYPHRIDLNCLPHIDVFLDNGYTKEEMKMTHETRKIMGDEGINLCATTVRVPVMGGHSEAVNVEFEKDFAMERVRELLQQTPGVLLEDDPSRNQYPMPLHCQDRDEVFVGRVRRDFTRDNCLNMWVVADNLRKGAATNAVQIAEALVGQGLM
ncbi:MAG: aspartate-semialdehyde dehydrogenase [Bacteroidetes bacterium]|nr:aspartate-semialdehyde dehydrogenase [Bacteroidota bacterium]